MTSVSPKNENRISFQGVRWASWERDKYINQSNILTLEGL